MRISRPAKTIFIIINYVTAVMIPPEARASIRITASRRHGGTTSTSSSLETHSMPDSTSPAHIFVRQGSENSCDRCRKCKGRRIRSPTNCRQCVPCPPGMKPDPTHLACIPDDKSKCPNGQKRSPLNDECSLDCAEGKTLNKNGDKCEMKCPNGKLNQAGDKCEPCPNDDCDVDCPLGTKYKLESDKCELECPVGQKPGPKGDKCEPCPDNKCDLDCPLGKKPNLAGDKCEIDCPAGNKPGPTGDKCEPCPNNKCDLDCPLGKKANPAGDKCELDCPAGKKPGPAGDKCEPCPNNKCDNDNKDKKKMTKEEKEKAWEEQRPKRRKQYKESKWPKALEKAKEKYKEKEKIKHDNEKRKKVRRMGRCLPLVVLGGGAALAGAYADNFFDEDFLESMDLLELWPADLAVEPWDTEESDKIFEDDKYINEWVDLGNDLKPGERPAPGDWDYNVGTKTDVKRRELSPIENQEYDGPRSLLPYDEKLDKRFIQGLIPIFMAVFRTAAQAAIRVGAQAGRVLSRFTVRVAKQGSSAKSRKDQLEGAKKIKDNRNWMNCLKRSSPK